jgi:hypothetical protein
MFCANESHSSCCCRRFKHSQRQDGAWSSFQMLLEGVLLHFTDKCVP